MFYDGGTPVQKPPTVLHSQGVESKLHKLTSKAPPRICPTSSSSLDSREPPGSSLLFPILPCICTCPLAFQKGLSIPVLPVILWILENALPFITFSAGPPCLPLTSDYSPCVLTAPSTEHRRTDVAGACPHDCLSHGGRCRLPLLSDPTGLGTDWALRNGPWIQGRF